MLPQVGVTHHIKLGPHYFLLRQGSYRKRPAPLFGSRFATGDPDYNNLSFWQHWVQTCWVGGFGAETWRDDAMFDEGVGIDSTQHEVMVLSRDLGPNGATRASQNWDLNNESAIKIFHVYNSKLYALQCNLGAAPSRLYRLDNATMTWILIKTFVDQVRWMDTFSGWLVFGDAGTTLNRMNAAEGFSTFAKPAGVTDVAYTMRVYRGKCYYGFGRSIWRLKSDFTWDGGVAFYVAEDVDYLNQSEIHLGFLYFMSQNGHLLRTDGNNTFDIWAYASHVKVWGLRSFDGRLFVGTAEDLDGTTSAEIALYQFTGAAVTELKRWGRIGFDCTPGKLRAFGSRLYFGASVMLGMGSAGGFGIAAYDPREDSYHLQATSLSGSYAGGTEGVGWAVDDIAYYRGYFYCSSRNHGIFRTEFSYRDVSRYAATYDTTAAGAAPGSMNGGWYTTSDFDAGTPGLLKMWNAVTVHVDLPTIACSVVVECSMDGGVTWVYAGGNLAAATVGGVVGETGRVRKTIELQGGGLRGGRLKMRLTLRTTDTTRSPALRGVIVRYLPLPEPNWMWEFDIVLSDDQELLDGTRQAPDVAALTSYLDTAYRNQQLLVFTDIDGLEWKQSGVAGVLVFNMERQVPYSGPINEGTIESVYRITLLEAVEGY